MNSTIESTRTQAPTGIWKRLRMEYVVAVAGIALAVSALGGLVTLDQEGKKPGSSAAASRPAFSTWNPSRNDDSIQIVYYLVNSQEQANELQQAITDQKMAAYAMGADLSLSHDYVRIVETPEQQQMVVLLGQDLNQAYMMTGQVNTRIVDVR